MRATPAVGTGSRGPARPWKAPSLLLAALICACGPSSGLAPAQVSGHVTAGAPSPMGRPWIPEPALPGPVPSDPAVEAAAQGPAVTSAGWLGIALGGPVLDQAGVTVTSVLRGSPAALAGLAVGDVLLACNGEALDDPAQFSRRIAGIGAGRRVNLRLRRGSELRLLAVTLGENPGLEGQLRLGFVDAPAPELEGVEVAQGNVGPSLRALRGRVVVLEFWANWCPACRALSPLLNDWQERFSPERARIVSVTVDSSTQAARDAAQFGLRYAVLADPEGASAQLYQAFALPTLFVIDRDGIVRDVAVGFDPKRLAAIAVTIERLSQPTEQRPS
jgi:thiol-disulfide isomerase/thioredoxin